MSRPTTRAVTVALAATVAAGVALVAWASAAASQPARTGAGEPHVVVVHAPVAVAKSAPPPPAPRVVNLVGLETIDPLHVVPNLPGLDGLAQLRTADGSAWRTVVVMHDTAAFATPGGAVVGAVPATTLGVPTTLPVLDQDGPWLRVVVATRGALPSQGRTQVNGHSVWIHGSDTMSDSTTWSVHVDVEALTLTIDDGSGPRAYPIRAVGAPATPTPRTVAFVLGPRWLEPGTATPRVIPLSIQSDSIDHWDKPTGTAVTAIHTTTSAQHGDVSNGCIRVDGPVLDALWGAPAGTLVTIS